MGRVALKIAYNGTTFHGHARQPGLRTVEGEVILALTNARVIGDAKASRFQSASRTDRGVSALGNVVAFDTPRSPQAAARALNGKARHVWCWAATAVPADLNPRNARERWYRYALAGTHSLNSLNAALRVFVGQHNFTSFTRDRDRTVLRIDVARASRERNGVVLDFRGPTFRWNLIRRLVSAAISVERGDIPLLALAGALEGSMRRDFGLAPPEPLTLMEVVYDFSFAPIQDPTTRDRVKRLLESESRATRFTEDLYARFAESSPPPRRTSGRPRSP